MHERDRSIPHQPLRQTTGYKTMSNPTPSIDSRLAQLVAITEQQAETAKKQADNIERLTQSVERFATIFGEMARAITELSQTTKEAVATSQRAASAAEAAAVVAQNNQNAIRDLIDELRQGK